MVLLLSGSFALVGILYLNCETRDYDCNSQLIEISSQLSSKDISEHNKGRHEEERDTSSRSAGSELAPEPKRRPSEEAVNQDGYLKMECGAIADNRSGLTWFVGPDLDLTWDAAARWVANLNACGRYWRMPTIDEISSLYDPAYSAGRGFYVGGEYWPARMHPVFSAIGNGAWIWSKSVGGSSAQAVNMNQGIQVTLPRSNTKFSTRAFAVWSN